jgi:hypothetical protein
MDWIRIMMEAHTIDVRDCNGDWHSYGHPNKVEEAPTVDGVVDASSMSVRPQGTALREGMKPDELPASLVLQDVGFVSGWVESIPWPCFRLERQS